MTLPPAVCPVQPPASHSCRISGEVLWVGPSWLMYNPVPYIPSPLVPAGDLRGEEQCCHVCMVLRMPYAKWTTAAGFHRSLHVIVERPPAPVDCNEHLWRPQQHKHLAEIGVYRENGKLLATRLNWEFLLVSTRGHFPPSKLQLSHRDA